ncbi:MAG: PorV/PorQ family protein [candidate division KSB1 bacterium]|nr:PorV/PorQ family protein [candidate division KSB1 bacterium]
MFTRKLLYMLVLLLIVGQGIGYGQRPYRLGTTAGSFLEIGVGSIGVGRGDAYTAAVNDLTAIYWNPAGLANMEKNQALFSYQTWVADINNFFAGIGLVVPQIGSVGLSISGLDYGNIEVTNMDYQNGTGEMYNAYDYAISLCYARSLATWFSFGAAAKYITSKIWHTQASAFALDLGVQVQTHFFSTTGRREDGMKLGMSISNYGTKMRFDGDDLLFPVDIDPGATGNYQNAQGKHNTKGWELPLVFRVGVAVDPVVASRMRLTISADALHPNNMSELVNLGLQYQFTSPGFGDFFLRSGYKALFVHNSQYGFTFGGGVKWWIAAGNALNVDYAFYSLGELGNVHCTTIGFSF